MFTGIVIDVGIIKSLKKTKKEIEMTIYTENIASLKEGMSISCAGICLTVVSFKIMRKGIYLMYLPQMKHYPRRHYPIMKRGTE